MKSLNTKPLHHHLYFFILSILVAHLSVLSSCNNQPKPQQTQSDYVQKIAEDRRVKNMEITDSTKSRFNALERKAFAKKGLKYYAPDEDYIVEALFTIDTSKAVFQMPTTSDRKPNYRVYGYLDFSIHDTLCRLTVYQNMDFKNSPDYDGTVFIPFKDNTNEFGSYGGGRYLDIAIPSSDKIFLDFNLAYNPYCAYSDRWSCPLVPLENTLEVSVFAGEKAYK